MLDKFLIMLSSILIAIRGVKQSTHRHSESVSRPIPTIRFRCDDLGGIKIDKKGAPCYSSVAVVQGRYDIMIEGNTWLGSISATLERGAAGKYRPHLVGER